MAVCPIWIRGGGWLQLGQHNLDKCCGKDVCVDLKEKMGCVVHGGILDQYGIGVSLYFKFLSSSINPSIRLLLSSHALNFKS